MFGGAGGDDCQRGADHLDAFVVHVAGIAHRAAVVRDRGADQPLVLAGPPRQGAGRQKGLAMCEVAAINCAWPSAVSTSIRSVVALAGTRSNTVANQVTASSGASAASAASPARRA